MYREGIKPEAVKLNLFEAVDLIIKRSLK
jgi:hypothetical protein